MIRNTMLLTAFAALVGGCDPGEDALALACQELRGADAPTTPAAAGITLTPTSGLKADPTATELVIGGVAEHEHDFAIRRIQVGGVDATSQAFNFSRWTAALKLDALRTLPRDAEGRVTLAVSVTDACGTYVADPLSIDMDVPRFTLATRYPHGADYIPDDGVTEAILTISADKSAAGSELRVSAEPPDGLTFIGLTGDRATLVAVGDGAQAQVRVASKLAGDVTLQVRSTSALESATLKVAAPPRFVPGDLVLPPSAVRNVTVLSEGRLRECQAAGLPGLAVTLAGADITKAPASDPGDGRAWVLTVAADAMIGEGTATVTCRDTFLRESTLAVTLDP